MYSLVIELLMVEDILKKLDKQHIGNISQTRRLKAFLLPLYALAA